MLNIATAVVAAVLAAAGASPDRKPDTLHRFFDLQLATVETRYRYVENSAGVTTANQWQHKEMFKGAFKFDEKGRLHLQALLGTGNGFTASWDTTGVGTGDPAWDFRVRRLWVRAVPVDGLELSAGSFDVVRGETTEIMSYDNDAYMQGYRVSVKRPAQAFFDEISVTAGYLGDLTQPNVFERFKWMDNHNYTQALVAKRVGKVFAASIDWTSVDHVDTVREGVRIGAKDLRSSASSTTCACRRISGWIHRRARACPWRRSGSSPSAGWPTAATRTPTETTGCSTATATASVTACTAADPSTCCRN